MLWVNKETHILYFDVRRKADEATDWAGPVSYSLLHSVQAGSGIRSFVYPMYRVGQKSLYWSKVTRLKKLI